MERQYERNIEWQCQKILLKYLHHVDRREFDAAANLFTQDARWFAQGVSLQGRNEILEALYSSLSDGTIRHVFTNTIVTVTDDKHAICRSYHSIYYNANSRIEDSDKPLPFQGPHRIADQVDKMVLTDEGWRIYNLNSYSVFRRNPDELVTIERWAKSVGKGVGKAG